MWKEAVEKANSFDIQEVITALGGMKFNSPAGVVKMDTENHHLAKHTIIGEIEQNGQFKIVNETKDLVHPEPFSKFAK